MQDRLFLPVQTPNGQRRLISLRDVPSLFSEGDAEPDPVQPTSLQALRAQAVSSISALRLRARLRLARRIPSLAFSKSPFYASLNQKLTS